MPQLEATSRKLNLREVGCKTSIDVTNHQEGPNLGLGRGVFCLSQSSGIVLDEGESPWSNVIPKVVVRLCEEVALLQLEGYYCLAQESQGVVEMTKMLCHSVREHYDVVKIDEAMLSLDAGRYDIYGALTRSRCVGQPDWNANEPVRLEMGRERLLILIARSDTCLPISTVAIVRSEYCRIAERVDALVHTRQRVAVPDG